ncbi:hypothetical protein NPX13_g8641 [Xylaria arbuscula]|uniref:Uncharacterized protein n=1 Tax=Xylaria arbuscula TaxID=114810 RepID=A0A9W8TJY9_9PEZI|nr:hypothetical protein NPX13_g8641 [Xylaria arbuscula]
MAGSSEATESSSPSNLDQEPQARQWSQYELDTVCALICKYEHLASANVKRGKRGGSHYDYTGDWVLSFATKLNEALHGTRGYKHDIASDDVKELMDFIETKNEAVMNYIQRQSAPFRVSRAKKFAFQRLYQTFSRAFFEWTLTRREKRHDPSSSDGEEETRSLCIDYSLSSQEGANYLLGAARNEKNLQPVIDPNRGRIPNSIYGRRGRDASTTSSQSQDGKAYPSPRTRVRGQHWLRCRNRRRAPIHIPPPPPPPPPPPHEGSAVQSTYMDTQLFTTNETGPYHHPAWHAYYENPYLDSSATPLAPPSPAYFGHADLRQSIHPTGPRPETPMRTHNDRPEQESFSRSEASMLPVCGNSYNTLAQGGYEYPEPQQEAGSYNYSSTFESPASPVFEPKYVTGDGTSTEGPFHLNYNNGYSYHYEPASDGSGTEFVDY